MYGSYPYLASPAASTSLLGRAASSFSWAKLFSGAQKTLGFINQAIPAFYNIQPVVRNAKTMFKVLHEFKASDVKPSTNQNNFKTNTMVNKNNEKIVNPIENFNSPTFFQ